MSIPRIFSCLILSFLISGLFIAIPNITFAQPLGCCTNAGNNQCQPNQICTEVGPGATCQTTQAQCEDPPIGAGGNNWLAGSTCLITGVERQCGPDGGSAGTPCCYSDTLEGCCQLPGGTLVEESELQCAIDGGTFLNEGPCVQPPTGCCQSDLSCDAPVIEANCPSAPEGWTIGAPCLGDTCGGVVPIDGCCQTEISMCIETTNIDCADDPFFPGGTCAESDAIDSGPLAFRNGESFCEPPPVGCCVIEQGVCEVTTEPNCDDQGGDYQGDDTSCLGNPLCEAPEVVRNVPSLSQWGLIATAGLLGIFSLIILRRKKYNLG